MVSCSACLTVLHAVLHFSLCTLDSVAGRRAAATAVADGAALTVMHLPLTHGTKLLLCSGCLQNTIKAKVIVSINLGRQVITWAAVVRLHVPLILSS